MRGILLAAGRGSRMGDLTAGRPKCLIPLGGRPLLDWQAAALRAAGVKELGIVRGYLAHLLRPEGFALFDNPRWAETNMVATLAAAREWLETGPCLVSYTDILFHPQAVRALAGVEAELAVTYDRCWRRLWSERFPDPLADAETFRLDPRGGLAEIGGRPGTLAEIGGQYMGLLRFSPAGWRRAAALLAGLDPVDRDRLDMTSLLRRLLARGVAVAAVPVEGRWCEVDSEADLRLYEAKLAAGGGWSHDWRW